MITLILSLFTLAALSFDYIIFRRHIPKFRWVRILYVAQALILDIGVLAYLVLSFFRSEILSDSMAVAATWLMLAFMMSFVTKGIFGTFSLIELFLSKKARSGYRPLTIIGGILAITALSAMVYGSTIGRTRLRVEHIVLELEDLPLAFDGFRIAQFSDVHLGNMSPENPLVQNMVNKINELNPDIVVQSGDLVNIHSGELNPERMAQLSQIKAPVYAVLGNHDLGYYIRGNSITPQQNIKDIVAKEQVLGWTLLNNSNQRIYRDSDSIVIAGAGYPTDGRLGVRNLGLSSSNLEKTFQGVSDSEFSILIAHTPMLFDSIPKFARPRLTLSGHVHAMQAKISIGDWRWSPAKWLFPMWSGLYLDRGHYLYINDGIGYALYPMRIGTRPEITLYELKKPK